MSKDIDRIKAGMNPVPTESDLAYGADPCWTPAREGYVPSLRRVQHKVEPAPPEMMTLGGDGREEVEVDRREWECRVCGGLLRGITAKAQRDLIELDRRRAKLSEVDRDLAAKLGRPAPAPDGADFAGPRSILRDIPDAETVVFACPACGRVAPRYTGKLPGSIHEPDDERMGLAAAKISAAYDPEHDPYLDPGERAKARKARLEREQARWEAKK